MLFKLLGFCHREGIRASDRASTGAVFGLDLHKAGGEERVLGAQFPEVPNSVGWKIQNAALIDHGDEAENAQAAAHDDAKDADDDDDDWDAVDIDEKIAKSNLGPDAEASDEEEEFVARPTGELSSRLAALAASNAEAKQAAEKRKEEVIDKPCTSHAQAMHKPCTCHAHAMHMPCT